MVNQTEMPYVITDSGLHIWKTSGANLYLHLPMPITPEQENELIQSGFSITRRSLEPTNEGAETDYVYTLSQQENPA